MDKKTRSKPMTAILDRLRAYGEFDIIIFGDALILDERIPISAWPQVHCLISFASKGFPLQRVIEYVRLRKPFSVNDLPSQAVLQNRADIYNILEKHNIPTPRHLYVDRSSVAADGTGGPEVLEFDDYITIEGVRLDKPLVEKPYDGDDHNIYIYYGQANGGGSRRLFRKVGNRSSRFYPKVNSLRKSGSYIYESLLQPGRARDLKVYTIGPGYAHGEMRKSPVVDGVVARDPDQKELRLLTKLTDEEREIARGICVAFKQNICGFDIIRTGGKSYVIDVNGWSFVKGNMRYYDKCWGAGTPLMLFDGRTMVVEEICARVDEGEVVQLMGDDSQPRTIQADSVRRGNTGDDAADWKEEHEDHTTSEIEPATYRITSTNRGRLTWICNGQHILVLQINSQPQLSTNNCKPSVSWFELDQDGKVHHRIDTFASQEEAETVHAVKAAVYQPVVYETTVDDFIRSSIAVRTASHMFHPPLVRFPSPDRSLQQRLEEIFLRPVTPAEVDQTAWLLGMWLTDGDDHVSQLVLSQIAPDEAIVASEKWFPQLLQSYGVLNNKHFPHDLLRESPEVRRALLTGVVDGDGHYQDQERMYYIVTKERSFIDGVIHLCRSLGLSTGEVNHTVTRADDGKEFTGQRIALGGAQLHEVIQPRTAHKRCPSNEELGRDAKSDQRCDGFTVEKVAHAAYFGFRVNGNGRVLMGDFVVSHNCARIMRKMCLNCIKGREALRLDRALEFIQMPPLLMAAAATPTAASSSSSTSAAPTPTGTFPQLAAIEAIPEGTKEGAMATPKHIRATSKETKEKEATTSKKAENPNTTVAPPPVVPRLVLPEKLESDAALVSSTDSTVVTPGASAVVPFGSFQLDCSASSNSSTLTSLLVSPSNPKALGVTMASNVIADSDNNDILLGLVAMFRHADRTPKQKVKLKTKSATLMQLFDEQQANSSKADSGSKDTTVANASQKKKHRTTATMDITPKALAAPSEAATPTPVAEKEKEPFQYKDLKYKKKTELTRLREAIKVLVVKEQLREKRKKKAAAAALSQALVAETGGEASGEAPSTAMSSPLTPAASLGSTGTAADWSDDETDLGTTGGAVLTGTDPDAAIPDDNVLEAAISAEQERERTRDAQKDPDYLLKLLQISSVLEKGYGGVKVQLKPRKVEGGKVVQALLIVKWGGEMTHAGVGQARQYAAAFWDDMVPPPYSTPAVAAKPGLSIANPGHPGTTTALASLANTMADTPLSGGLALIGLPAASPLLAMSQPMDRERAIQAAMIPDTHVDPSSSSPVLLPSSPTLECTPLPSPPTQQEEEAHVVSPSHASTNSHEFAYDHNSSLTQGDRAKLKNALVAARSSGVSSRVQSIPEHAAVLPPATPKRMLTPTHSQSTPPAATAAAPTSEADSSTMDAPPAPAPTRSEPTALVTMPPSSARKQSRIASNLLSLTSAQGKEGAPSLVGGKDFSAGPGDILSPSPVSSGSSDFDKLSAFRRHRLAFFQGLQIYSSDEARVVASAEAFYTSTFEHAHGLGGITMEQAKDKEEKKKIQLIKEWIETSRKLNISHDKAVQVYLDDTSKSAESMARAKECVKFILMSESGLTPAQVTRHMLAQEQIARATSEAERANILQEEEELLRAARAEAEAREREEQVQAVSLRQQQIEEEQMEQLMDRVSELEEDGMNLEAVVASMRDHAKRRLACPESPAAPFDFSLGETASSTSPEVVAELEELLSKIYTKLFDAAAANSQSKKKKHAKHGGVVDVLSGVAGSFPPQGDIVAPVASFDPAGMVRSSPTPPAITPPPSPSSFGPSAMTEWGIRCLRWIGKPRNTLVKLYELLLQLQVQINSKCEWAERNAPVEAAAETATSPKEKDSTAPATDGTNANEPTGPHHRKMSGGSSGMLAGGASLPDAAVGLRSSSSTRDLLNAPLATKPKAASEFEYVALSEEGDEEIMGNSNGGKEKKRTQAGRFSVGHLLCQKETLFLMKSRWDNLIASFHDVKENTFDPTKLPDIYDCIKYDVLHNMEFLSDIRPLYSAIKRLADFVVPNEYGASNKDKWSIGVGIAKPLLHRMIDSLESALSPKCPSRVTLYFSSESHIHALRNVLLLSGIAVNRTVATALDATELGYLSHAVFRLYEDVSKPIDDPLRYYVNVQFSPGASLDPSEHALANTVRGKSVRTPHFLTRSFSVPALACSFRFVFTEFDHTLPVSRPVPVAGRIPFEQFKMIFLSLGSMPPPPSLLRGTDATQPSAAGVTPLVSAAPSPRR